MGTVIDIVIEAANDEAEFEKQNGTRTATQADINKFFG